MSGTHYGASMTPEVLYPWAKKMARSIVRKILANPKGEFILPVLVYRGMSGTTTATAIMAFIPEKHRPNVGMVYVRKENETSHGCDVEHTYNVTERNKTPVFIFCDDFIDAGATLVAVVHALIKLRKEKITPDRMLYALSKYNDDSSLRKFNKIFERHWTDITGCSADIMEELKAKCDDAYNAENEQWKQQAEHLKEFMLDRGF